jgi:hypothetical protein
MIRSTSCALLGVALMTVCLPPRGSAQSPEEQKQFWEAQQAKTAAQNKANAELLAQQRAARKADPMAWVRTLNPMAAGGWEFRGAAMDGSWAIFSTDHQLKRSGHTVTLWLRQEFPEAQRDSGGDIYQSNIEKVEFDCAKSQQRVLTAVFYSENNTSGTQQQQDESDPKHVPWQSIIPGTQSESVFQWACNGSRKK